MSDITKERAGFGGQNVNVAIMNEAELLGEAHGYPSNTIGGWLNPILNRALKDPGFIHIRLIDEYGTTFFNSLQLLEVTKELKRLHEFTTSPEETEFVTKVLDMAEQVSKRVHHFLVFLGD